ncbi:hypothetical protein AMTRI_Chr06g195820 [Amborella trichopoda]
MLYRIFLWVPNLQCILFFSPLAPSFRRSSPPAVTQQATEPRRLLSQEVKQVLEEFWDIMPHERPSNAVNGVTTGAERSEAAKALFQKVAFSMTWA